MYRIDSMRMTFYIDSHLRRASGVLVLGRRFYVLAVCTAFGSLSGTHTATFPLIDAVRWHDFVIPKWIHMAM